MMIVVGVLVALAVVIASQTSKPRTGHYNGRGLERYGQQNLREGSFPFDYLSR